MKLVIPCVLSAILTKRYMMYIYIYIVLHSDEGIICQYIQLRMLKFCPETESLQDLCMLVFHLQK